MTAAAPPPTRADVLREHLLRLTIQHAIAYAKYYEKTIAHIIDDDFGLADLPRLPLLTRSDLEEHADDLRTIFTFPDYLMYTSGTTTVPLEVPVYQSEVDAWNEYVLDPMRARFGLEAPLTLSVQRVGHGSAVLTSSVPTIPCHINYGIEQLITFLEGEHWAGGRRARVEVLDANVLHLRELTTGLLAAGRDPREFGLSAVTTSGWHVTSWERRTWQEIWGAPVMDRYGVTEVHGDAKWCLDCEHYHFDFGVVPEFLDPDTMEPVDEGLAVMVVTGLYPFNQAVPKIRYRIGDLVEVAHTGCASRERGVRFRSRERDAVGAGPGQVFPVDVAELLAPLPDVARKVPTGFVKFRLSAPAPDAVLVEVELTYVPAAFPERSAELRDELRAGLARPGREVDVQFLPPGGLATITKL